MFEKEVDISSRKHAAFLLCEKLLAYKDSDAHVVAIPDGGVPVGYWLSRQLNLTLQILPCRMITIPGRTLKSLGSVSIGNISVHEEILDVPQAYLYHQIQRLKNNVETELNFYNALQTKSDFKNKVVIIVDDAVLHSDGVKALVRSIRLQRPEKLIVAAPFITDEASTAIAQEVDEVIYLFKDRSVERIRNMVSAFPKISREDVEKLLQPSAHS